MGERKKMPPVHPGEILKILKEEFLLPMGRSEYRLAKDINVPAHYDLELARDEIGEAIASEVTPREVA